MAFRGLPLISTAGGKHRDAAYCKMCASLSLLRPNRKALLRLERVKTPAFRGRHSFKSHAFDRWRPVWRRSCDAPDRPRQIHTQPALDHGHVEPGKMEPAVITLDRSQAPQVSGSGGKIAASWTRMRRAVARRTMHQGQVVRAAGQAIASVSMPRRAQIDVLAGRP